MGMILMSFYDAESVPRFLFCDVQCLSSVQMVETFSGKNANSSSQKSRLYFWEEDTAGTHGRD